MVKLNQQCIGKYIRRIQALYAGTTYGTMTIEQTRRLEMITKAKAQQSSSLYLKVLRRIKAKLRAVSNIPITYRYQSFSIKLPSNHLLPDYQKTHPKYDRFLPHLSKHIDKSETIIDIGANVGDTLAGMVEYNSQSRYVCIEPDDYFFNHLEENIKRIKDSITDLNVETIKALVGTNITGAKLEGKGGTKHAVVEKGGSLNSLPLDEIISSDRKIKLLKSDVDGFDYDVLDSAMSVIKKHMPMIFFECQYDFESQKIGYIKTLKTLDEVGYCDWIVFDNFGEVIVRTDDLSMLTQLMEYIWQQNIGNATRTIYYYDILAVQQNDSALIDRVLNEYN